jgi:hypothetical protein
MMLQLANSMVRYLAGITEDILVKIWDCYIPVDFMVVDMEVTKVSTLILGWPFLSIAKAQIDVIAREIHFNIHGNEEKFTFRPKKEQCSMICIKYGPNPQILREVHIQPQAVDRPVKKNKEIKKKPEQKKVKHMTKEKALKAIPTRPKKNKPVWKPKEEAPKSTTTPPRTNKMVWRPKKE